MVKGKVQEIQAVLAFLGCEGESANAVLCFKASVLSLIWVSS